MVFNILGLIAFFSHFKRCIFQIKKFIYFLCFSCSTTAFGKLIFKFSRVDNNQGFCRFVRVRIADTFCLQFINSLKWHAKSNRNSRELKLNAHKIKIKLNTFFPILMNNELESQILMINFPILSGLWMSYKNR